MTIIYKIETSVNKKAILRPGSNGILHIEEKKDSGTTKLKNVYVTGLKDAIGINQDNAQMSVFDEKSYKKAKKTCDAIIFSRSGDDLAIAVLDLKSSLSGSDDFGLKTMSGHCFAKYVISVLELFEGIKAPEHKFYYCILYPGDPKRTTGINDSDPSCPRLPMLLKVQEGERISFNRI